MIFTWYPNLRWQGNLLLKKETNNYSIYKRCRLNNFQWTLEYFICKSSQEISMVDASR